MSENENFTPKFTRYCELGHRSVGSSVLDLTECGWPNCTIPMVPYLHDFGDYVTNVLALFYQADDTESLMWSIRNGQPRFSADCSDLFMWATADSEDIGPDDVPLLRQCLADLECVDTAYFLSELFCSRKRRMRPMLQFKGGNAASLFETCGDERTPGDEDWWRPGNAEDKAAGRV